MKTLLILTLLTISAFAHRNPQIRTCNITLGTFNVYDIPGDNIGHCIYGSASIDTISLMDKVYENKESIAVDEFMDGRTQCRGQIVDASNERETMKICQYYDGSSVRLSTLENGVNSSANKKLVDALNTLF